MTAFKQEWVTFAINDPTAFQALEQFVQLLIPIQQGINRNEYVAEPAWESYYQSLELRAINPEKLTDHSSFADLVDNLLELELEFDRLEQDGTNGKLLYTPWSYPFGGTYFIEVLLERFGFEINEDSWE